MPADPAARRAPSLVAAYRGDGLRDSLSVPSASRTFTWDVSGGLPGVLDDSVGKYIYGNGLVSQKAGGSTYYHLTDGLGSMLKTVDQNGSVANSYQYDAYGNTTSQSGSQTNDFKFAGQTTDSSTGLQYLRARYYDPDTGRFISRDPLAAKQGYNGSPFGYAGGNPVNASDPTGLCGDLFDWPDWLCGYIRVYGTRQLQTWPLPRETLSSPQGTSSTRGSWHTMT